MRYVFNLKTAHAASPQPCFQRSNREAGGLAFLCMLICRQLTCAYV
jgi:hypothetical protein